MSGWFNRSRSYSQELQKGDFEKRFSLKPPEVNSDKTVVIRNASGMEYLESARRRPGRPLAIAPFEDSVINSCQALPPQSDSKKLVGTLCRFVPEELILAVGGRHLRLCSGDFTCLSAAEEVLPRDICPLVKATYGGGLLGRNPVSQCDVIVVPATCDAKIKLAEILNDQVPVWLLDLPLRKRLETSHERFYQELCVLKDRLQNLTGNKVTRPLLREAIETIHRRQAAFRKIMRFQTTDPPLLSGRDMLIIAQSSFNAEPEIWTSWARDLIRELESMSPGCDAKSKSRPARLLLTGAPVIWPNWKLPTLIEEAGAWIVADDLCSGSQYLYDVVETDEGAVDDMMRDLAGRYLLPSTCPCFSSVDDRLDRILNLIEEFNVDGVVQHGLRLCQLFDMETRRLRETLRQQDIPFLNVQTDYSQEDVEQVRTRIEAFLELLSVRG